MKIALLILLIATVATKSVACECAAYELAELDRRSFKNSEIVLIGDVLMVGASFKVKIIEVLKGKLDSEKINGTVVEKDGVISNCVSFPREEGRYIFYFNRITRNYKNYYFFNQCSGTRLINAKCLPVSLRSKK